MTQRASISRSAAALIAIANEKSPARAGLFAVAGRWLFLLLRSDRDVYTPIGLQAGDQLILAQAAAVLIARILFGFTASFRADGIGGDALVDQILLDRCCASLRQVLVVERGSDRVGEADCKDLTI